jgi:hypothetical protein
MHIPWHQLAKLKFIKELIDRGVFYMPDGTPITQQQQGATLS